MDEDLSTLSDAELGRLLQAAHASLEIRQRNQFFRWAQGPLFSLVPHELLVCVHGIPGHQPWVCDHFSSYPMAAQDLDRLFDPGLGFMAQAARVWLDHGETPLLRCAATGEFSAVGRRLEGLAGRELLERFAFHGMPTLPGVPATLFAFGKMPRPLTPRTGYLVELLVPHLHVAFMRMLGNERLQDVKPSALDRLITAREVEILQWVSDGKSNQEIGHILGISPLTVKNHVQKILKKLEVQNRAQAVSKALSLQLIRTGPGQR
jgi:transcriptional regulator EpsA